MITSPTPGILRLHRVVSVCALLLAAAAHAADSPETVRFASRDGRTELVGYLFSPSGTGPFPAVVMMHGRSGAYSAAAKGRHDAGTLSQRHVQWGRFWAERGYLALHVDSFGPRGHGAGFAAGTYRERPLDINEQSVRPLDAYGAVDYLRRRGDVRSGHIGLHGWSNGAMAALAAMAQDTPGAERPTPDTGFRAAIAYYPGCTIQTRQDYRPYAPLLLLMGSEDEEVNAGNCRRLADQLRERGAAGFEFAWYEGATHSFDDPGKRRQANTANAQAREDSMRRAARYFAAHLGGRQ